jgi:glycosyltransferase involved in cell wall biosynthesis
MDNFDVFFSPFPAIPDKIRNIPSIKIFHVLHDCIPFLNGIHTMGIDSNQLFVQLANGLNRETYYLCNSLSTKNDFLKLFSSQLDETKIFVIPHASSHNFIPDYDKANLQKVFKKYGIKSGPGDLYIFSLCNIDPRKNLIFTVRCFIEFIKKNNIENLYFYLGGGHFKGYISQFAREISSFREYSQRIVRLGYVDDEDVNILYSNSLFFTFLSQYEGFGVPPLESMQAGTPVICSNNSSLPEVVGDAAIKITYNDEAACIKAFEDLYFNEDLRKYYIEKGLERSKLFSWEKTVNIMTEVLTKVLT